MQQTHTVIMKATMIKDLEKKNALAVPLSTSLLLSKFLRLLTPRNVLPGIQLLLDLLGGEVVVIVWSILAPELPRLRQPIEQDSRSNVSQRRIRWVELSPLLGHTTSP